MRLCNGGMARYLILSRKCTKQIKKFHARKERCLLATGFITAFYKHVNSKRNASCNIAPIKDNSTLLTNDIDKALVFNKYFVSVFSPTIDINVLVRDSSILSSCVNFSSDLVYKALLNSKRTYSSGTDGIQAVFWANLASSVAVSISFIFLFHIILLLYPVNGNVLMLYFCSRKVIYM